MFDADAYNVEVDNEKKAILIGNGSKYWQNQAGKGRLTGTKTYYKLELIGTSEGSLTSIVEVETEVNNNVIEGIFDLTGRKIEEITKPGIYIINGKKTLVK